MCRASVNTPTHRHTNTNQMQLVLDTKGIKLTKKGGSFHIVGKKGSRTISPNKLSSIAITSSILLSTEAVSLAIQHRLPILFFDRIGKAKARLWSPYFESIATLRRQQVKFLESTDACDWMLDLFELKTAGQLYNLDFIKRNRLRALAALKRSSSQIKQNQKSFSNHRNQLPEFARNNIMGIEGSIARIYWQSLGGALPRKYVFQKRSRRPAEDIFNAAVNYLYGMLYSVVESGIFAAGLDPYLGIFHADEYTKPTLAFDLIEPFRPWVDLLLIEQCFQNKLDSRFFTTNQHGIFLNKTGKAYIIPLFNDFLKKPIKFLNREASTKNQIYYLAGLLAQRIRSQ